MAEEQKYDQGADPTPPTSTGAPTTPVSPQQPPMGQQMPPQQPPMGQAPQPVYAPTPLTHLSGGMKFGWFVIGALLGIGGIVLSWLVNVDKIPQVKSDALKWSIIGFVVWIVLGVIFGILIAGSMAAMMGAVGSYGYGYHGSW